MLLADIVDFEHDEYVHPLTCANEKKALLMLKNITLASLKRYKTTIKDDEALLKTVEKYSNLYNILTLRLGEKRILQRYSMMANAAIPFLNMDWKTLKKALPMVQAKLQRKDIEIWKYIQKSVVLLVRNNCVLFKASTSSKVFSSV